ncbi:MAG: metal-dependent hydrolase [Acidimicrobiales bacterium]|nr:metal-dependent hydrolase [Acidimicrobiales bacterium]
MARTIRTRRIAFDYPDEELPRHFMGGDLVMSHVVAVLSAMFPNGEDFFVRSVRGFRDEITDPELRQQVAGFIGQEAMHGREHRTFNERLAQLGYPTLQIDRLVDRSLRLRERLLSKKNNLALTAALEHYTATLAEVLLVDPKAREMMSVDEVRAMFVWHALEESEHKAVAFDVYEAVGGTHRMRALVMNITTVLFIGLVVFGTFWSLLHDRAAYNPRTLWSSLRKLRHSPWVNREIARHLRDYNRRGFHPDDRDSSALTDQWRNELFGAEGILADRLSVGAAAIGRSELPPGPDHRPIP